MASLETHAQAAKDKFHSIKKSLADKFKKQQSQNPPEPPSKDFLDTSSQENSGPLSSKPLPSLPSNIAAEAAKKKSNLIANDGAASNSVKNFIQKYEQVHSYFVLAWKILYFVPLGECYAKL